MELTDITPIENWCAIETDLYEKFNLQGSVFNTGGIRITTTKNWSNRLCPEIKSTDKGQSFICATAHMNMANQAMKSREAVIEECDAGLLKLVVPVFYKDTYLGVVGGCGLLARGGEVDAFFINKVTEMDEEKIEKLSSDIPVMTLKKAEAVCDYLQARLESILYKKTVP